MSLRFVHHISLINQDLENRPMTRQNDNAREAVIYCKDVRFPLRQDPKRSASGLQFQPPIGMVHLSKQHSPNRMYRLTWLVR